MAALRTSRALRAAAVIASRRPAVTTPYASTRVKDFGDSVWTEFTPLAVKHKAVNLSQGLPSIPVESFILDALAQAANPGMQHQYTRVAGQPDLVTEIADHYSPEYGREIDPLANICITTGATQGLFLFFQTFVNPGDEVIIIEPFYDSYIPQVEMAGGTVVPLALKPAPGGAATSADWTLDLDELSAAFSPKTKAILVNTPHNPTGKVFSKKELTTIADLAKKHDALVLADEVYEMITYEGSEHLHMASLPGMWERTVTLGSAGKAFNTTGWKLGWAVGPSELMLPLQLTQQYIPFCVSSPLQHALAQAWREAKHNGFFQRQRDMFTRKRDRLMDTLTEAGLTPTLPQASYFILADTTSVAFDAPSLPPHTRDYDFCRWLTKDIGVAAIPPSCFYTPAHAHLAANYARFCFVKTDEDIEAAAGRLLQLKA